MKSLVKLWQMHKVIRHRLDDLTTFKTTILSVLGGLAITLLIMAPLYLIIIPLFMFAHLKYILIVLIFILLIITIFLYEYFMYYVSGIIEPKIKNIQTKYLIIVEGTLMSIIYVIVGIIITVIILKGF
ncbi:hypothetical protein [Acholeplasma granularum]|uniref:hypothetical protein n=1 Tax=Acholeplasma granularum TaxID=264635 RepID=UPI0004720E13|nr:hypothetical protein [Acholeplasma granularum]